MKTKRIKTDSGLTGWKCNLQDNYSSFEDFEGYSNMYGLAARLGYTDNRECWEANPIVQGSVEPKDFRRS